jgi:hypothetical protein
MDKNEIIKRFGDELEHDIFVEETQISYIPTECIYDTLKESNYKDEDIADILQAIKDGYCYANRVESYHFDPQPKTYFRVTVNEKEHEFIVQ